MCFKGHIDFYERIWGDNGYSDINCTNITARQGSLIMTMKIYTLYIGFEATHNVATHGYPLITTTPYVLSESVKIH